MNPAEEKAAEAEENKTPKFAPWKRNVETFMIYLTFIGLGLAAGIFGPTLMHLAFLYETNIQGISIALVALNAGMLLGSILCGLVFELINRRLVFVLGNIVLGISLIIAPRIPYVYGFHALICVMGVGHGFLISASSPYIMTLWKGKLQAPLMQGMHAFFSLGAFVCPFLTIPFLIEIPQWMYDLHLEDQSNELESDNQDASSDMDLLNSTTPLPANITEAIEEVQEGLQSVKTAYMYIGLAILGVAGLGFAVFLIVKPSIEESTNPVVLEETKGKKVGKCLKPWKIFLLIFVFLFGVLYFWYDMVASALLSSFVMKGLHWHVEMGPLVTSVFFGCQAIGKLTGIPISYCLSPTKMLIGATVLAFLSYMLLAVAAMYYPLLVWVAAGMAGFSVATCFPSLIVWTGGHIKMTGALGGLFVVAAATGGITGSALEGYLFEVTYMMVPYLAICATAVNMAFFAVMNCIVVFNRRSSRRAEISGNGGLPFADIDEENSLLQVKKINIIFNPES